MVGGVGGTARNFLSNAAAGVINVHGTANAVAGSRAIAAVNVGSQSGVFDGIAVIEQFANNTNDGGLAKNTLVNAGN